MRTLTCAAVDSVNETFCRVKRGLIVNNENCASPSCSGTAGVAVLVGGTGVGRAVRVVVARAVGVAVRAVDVACAEVWWPDAPAAGRGVGVAVPCMGVDFLSCAGVADATRGRYHTRRLHARHALHAVGIGETTNQ